MSPTIIEKLLKGADVEWKPLGEIVKIADNARRPIKAELRKAGANPYYGANNIQDYVQGYTHEGEYVLVAEDGSKSLVDYSVQWACGCFWANNHVHVIQGNDKVNNRFLFYVLKNMNFLAFLSGGTRAKLTKAKLVNIPIPIPPLSVQKEIVRILDAFTAHTAELTAELNERKKQYNYYRDKLLTFSDDEVEWKPIDEIAEIYGGLIGKTKSDFEKGNAIYIPYKNIYDNISVDFNNVNLVNVSLDESQNRVEYGDILFTGSSETIEETGLSSVVTQKNRDPVYLNSFSFGVRINNKSLLIPDFSKYLFRSKFMRKEIIRCANGVTRFNLSKAHFKKIKIPIPPLSVQKGIVWKLDAFSNLATSISEGLPREIELRNKQYKYYRGQLLSFSKPDLEN